MKKIILLCLVAMTSISTGVAQKITAQWGAEVKPKNEFIITGTLGMQDGRLFLSSERMSIFGTYEFGITTVDVKTMKVIENNELETATKRTKQIATMMMKGKRWLFTRNTADKVDYIKGYPISDKGKVIETPTTLASFKDDKKSFLVTYREAEVSMIHSKDSSKIAMVINANRKKEDKELYYVTVFNTDLKEQ